MPRGQRKTRRDRDIVVEVLTRIRKAEAASGATCGKDRRVGANTLPGRQLHAVAAPRPGREARGTAKFQIGAGVARRQSQGFVECPAIEVQRGAVGREDVVPRPRLVASPNRQHFRRFTTERRLCETLETDARERLSQLGRRRLAEAWPLEVRPFDEQDAIACTRCEKSEDAAGRSGASNRDVVRAHRVQASAGKMVTYNLHAFDVARPFFLVVAVFFDLAAGLGAAAATSTAAGALLNSTS